jgi:PAS domain S-box-containing protein
MKKNDTQEASHDATLEANARLNAMLDSMAFGCHIIDTDGNVIDCSSYTVSMFGCESKEEYCEHFFDFSPEFQPDGQKSRKKALDKIRQAYALGEVVFYWEHRRPDGTPLPTKVTLRRVKWYDEWRVVGYLMDLTELKAKELEAAEAQERVHIMFDSVEVSCTIFDKDCNLIDCNAHTLNVFGYRDKNFFIENFFTIMPALQPDGSNSARKARAILQEVYDTGIEPPPFMWEYRTRDGQSLPMEVTVRRIDWRGDYNLVGTMQDLREMREAQARSVRFEVESRAARAASEAKSAFLATMSHEIRSPMNAIVGLADLIRTDNFDDRQRAFMHDIRSMSHVLLQIIDSILDFTKIEAGKFELTLGDYSIRRVFDNVCSLTLAAMGDKPLRFTHDIGPGVPETLYGDELRVQQILFNILSNAVKYTMEGAIDLRIERDVRDGLDFLRFIVRDTGIGIRKKDFPHLFDRFARFDSHKNQGIAGTGLGLPITKRLVEMMGGKISVDSKYGEGSTFSVFLPLIEGDPAGVTRAEDTSLLVMGLPDTRVLVVDDSEVNLTVALGYLDRHGIQADTATSGAEAIEKIVAQPYDLVFMDHMMPEMDGIETTQRIRAMEGERFRDMAIVALSANAVAEMREAFLAAGMNAFIGKPIDPNVLNRMLGLWLPPHKQRVSYEASGVGTRRRADDDFAVLDRDWALARLQGNEDLYCKLLVSFRRTHGDDAASLAAMLGAGDFRGATIAAHTLKSAAASIGAMRLKRAASVVETALANGGEISAFDERVRALRQELVPVLDEIARLTPEQPADEVAPFKPDLAAGLLDRLVPLLARGSAECLALDAEIERALSPLGALYREFAAAIDDIDYPSAQRLVPKLRQAIAEKMQ